MNAPHPRLERTTAELIEHVGIDPNDTELIRSYDKAIELAGRFIAWADAVQLEPVHVSSSMVLVNPSDSGRLVRSARVETPRIFAAFSRKGSHSHDHHDDHHDHGPKGNLLLPHFSIGKRFVAPEYRKETHARYWPIASQRTGLSPFPINEVWYVGQSKDRNGRWGEVGLFDNRSGTVSMAPAGNQKKLVEIAKTPDGQVPEPLSATRILTATARYALENNKNHMRF